jgi:hypothetical protein
MGYHKKVMNTHTKTSIPKAGTTALSLTVQFSITTFSVTIKDILMLMLLVAML